MAYITIGYTLTLNYKNYLICIKVFFMVNYMNISLLKSIVNNLFKNVTVMSDFFKCFRLTKLFSHSLRKLCIRLNILYIPPSYNNGQ